MNIYQVKVNDNRDVYYVLAEDITNARSMVENHSDFDLKVNHIQQYSKIPNTDVSTLLDQYKDIDPDKVPLFVLFIRNNNSYSNGNKAVFHNYSLVGQWFNEFLTDEFTTDYEKWIDENTVIENR